MAFKIAKYEMRNWIDIVNLLEANPWRPQDIPVFYHGTSSKNLEAIQRFGLVPQAAPESEFRGNDSTVHSYTERNIYLSSDRDLSLIYARCQVRHDVSIGIEGTYPVVFEVRIPDASKLLPDDDYINLHGSYHMWSQLKPEDKLEYKSNYVEPEFGGSVTDIARQRAAHQPYTQSLKKNDSVAYRGRIPANFIKLVS